MSAVNLIFPHQLFEESPLLGNGQPCYLIEEWLFFRQYAFHKQKLAFHRATMQFYARHLREHGAKVQYIESGQLMADVRNLLPELARQGIREVFYIDPADDWLERRLLTGATQVGIAATCCDAPMFLNTRQDLESFFGVKKKRYFQTKFYIGQRERRGILLDDLGKPLGGKWSYDADNRKKYPRKKAPPPVSLPAGSPDYEEAVQYVESYFATNPGALTESQLYPLDFEAGRAWLQQFLEHRFAEFGPYEDAIVSDQNILHHSVLTPLLNVGLLTPAEVIEKALMYAGQESVPLNSTEGFVRQIIGWREFIRGVYLYAGRAERTRNFWGFARKIPASFYDGSTGIAPLDITINKVLRTGYCHHIERLMVLGNFMLLCEFDPDEVYRWFMELFIDAYDWVMVPNVYGMSQFADGGLMSTKPYISGSNYILKMSNFSKGPWQEVWDALFWRFMHVHRDFFLSNPRLGMLIRTFDKMAADKQNHLLARAGEYLQSLDQ